MRHFFLVILTGCIAQFGCAQDTGSPYFPGLSTGIPKSELCTNYNDYSVKLSEANDSQIFEAFGNKNCTLKPIAKIEMDFDTQLAGIWNGYLVFDQGTDVNGHNIKLIALKNTNETYEMAFEGPEPEFSAAAIIYFAPSEKAATERDCAAIGLDFKDLKEHSADVLLGFEYQFDLTSKQSRQVPGKLTCYAVQ